MSDFPAISVSQGERDLLRMRPASLPVMRQSWRDLAFIHWRVPAETIQQTLPAGLTVDTFDGSAWVGLVPFSMTNVRPTGLPAINGLSTFLECNVRTYVHTNGKGPGVWFYSLDAANPLACSIARHFFGLPYYPARMHCDVTKTSMHYESQRNAGGLDLILRVAFQQTEPEAALEGTFAWWCLERYLLYTVRKNTLYSGRVHHKPYTFQTATLEHLQLRDNQLHHSYALSAPEHIAVSPGVDVSVYPLQPVR